MRTLTTASKAIYSTERYEELVAINQINTEAMMVGGILGGTTITSLFTELGYTELQFQKRLSLDWGQDWDEYGSVWQLSSSKDENNYDWVSNPTASIEYWQDLTTIGYKPIDSSRPPIGGGFEPI